MTMRAYKKKSKTQETKEKIISLIKIGKLKDGDCLLPEPQLSLKFGVSIVTLRRALDELEMENSIRRIQGKGTFVMLKGKKISLQPHFIKLLTPLELARVPEDNFFLHEIAMGIREEIKKSKYEMDLVCDFFYNEDFKNKEYISGIIGLMLPRETWTQVLQCASTDMPVVAVHIVPEFTALNISGFKVDNLHGGYMAVEYLIKNGHKNIGIVVTEDSQDALLRYEGYKKALETHFIKFNEDFVIRCDLKESSIIDFTRRLIENNPEITAIFAPGYYIARNVITALELQKVNIPNDVSFIGYDDPVFGNFEEMRISTIKSPLKEMGQKAASTIINMIEGREMTHSLTLFRPELIIRDSVKSINV